jgi:hypothetical protein
MCFIEMASNTPSEAGVQICRRTLVRITKYFPHSTVAYIVMVCSTRSGGEHTVDIVPGGTELVIQVQTGSWAGCTHLQ